MNTSVDGPNGKTDPKALTPEVVPRPDENASAGENVSASVIEVTRAIGETLATVASAPAVASLLDQLGRAQVMRAELERARLEREHELERVRLEKGHEHQMLATRLQHEASESNKRLGWRVILAGLIVVFLVVAGMVALVVTKLIDAKTATTIGAVFSAVVSAFVAAFSVGRRKRERSEGKTTT